MSEREPVLLGIEGGAFPHRPAPVAPVAAAPRGQAPTVHVHGFWRRAVAGAIDLAVVLPIAGALCWIAGKISGVGLPPMKIGLFDIDLWIDLVLALDSGLVMAMVLTWAIGLTYLLVFHIARGQTLGMRVMKMKIIDAYGDSPSPRRCLTRVLGYVASVATLGLGFLWIGFDSEKRGLHDWIAGTYVVRA